MRATFATHTPNSLREVSVGRSCCLIPNRLLSTKPLKRSYRLWENPLYGMRFGCSFEETLRDETHSEACSSFGCANR